MRSLDELMDTNVIIEEIPMGIIQFDHAGSISLMNNKALEFLKIQQPKALILSQKITDFIQDITLLNTFWEFTKLGWSAFALDNHMIGNRYLNISGIPINSGYLMYIIDNTVAAKALEKSTQSLLIGQEGEKRRIAKEIHDGIGQMISAVKLHLDFFKTKLSQETLKSEVDQISNMIKEVSQDLRSLSHDLMPSSLVDFGLVTAVKNLTKRINESKQVIIFFDYDIDDRDLNVNQELNMYRILQELINNTIKHSSGSEMHIALSRRNNHIVLEAKDDGIGAFTGEMDNGIGLFNIKNRLAFINGTLDIDTSPHQGFKVRITIPLK